MKRHAVSLRQLSYLCMLL